MTAKADQAAARMGDIAGRTFRDTGVPSRNPFGDGPLADAWRRAYFAATAKRS